MVLIVMQGPNMFAATVMDALSGNANGFDSIWDLGRGSLVRARLKCSSNPFSIACTLFYVTLLIGTQRCDLG